VAAANDQLRAALQRTASLASPDVCLSRPGTKSRSWSTPGCGTTTTRRWWYLARTILASLNAARSAGRVIEESGQAVHNTPGDECTRSAARSGIAITHPGNLHPPE
jgi:hypothetical protein